MAGKSTQTTGTLRNIKSNVVSGLEILLPLYGHSLAKRTNFARNLVAAESSANHQVRGRYNRGGDADSGLGFLLKIH